MSGFIEGESRTQATLFPESLDDYITEDNAVRVIDVFIDDLDISGLGFKTEPSQTGRPAYHPTTMLKLYVYGYLNRVQSSRRLEREAQRNVELMWLMGRLAIGLKKRIRKKPLFFVCDYYSLAQSIDQSCPSQPLIATAISAGESS